MTMTEDQIVSIIKAWYLVPGSSISISHIFQDECYYFCLGMYSVATQGVNTETLFKISKTLPDEKPIRLDLVYV